VDLHHNHRVSVQGSDTKWTLHDSTSPLVCLFASLEIFRTSQDSPPLAPELSTDFHNKKNSGSLMSMMSRAVRW